MTSTPQTLDEEALEKAARAIYEATSDNGSVLDKDAAAIIWSPKQGYFLKIPNMEGGQDVPEDILAITACFVRLEREPDFRRECIEWMHNLKDN